MKRRRFFQTAAAVSTAATLAAQQQPVPPPTPTSAANPAAAPPVLPGTPGSMELPKLQVATPDEAAATVQRFFTAPQFAALRKLADLLMPSLKGAPGALDAGAPEFLDFLLSKSPADRQLLYRAGLDALNAQAKKRFDKPFAGVDATQAATLLAPLKEPWTFDPPADPLARFLRAAKQDVRTATVNSREYVTAASAGSRRPAGVGLYWYPLV